MGSFGERLQREREMRGITLEEIAEATKIGTRSLRALEEQDFDKLPGGIFNKGFVRAYSRYLGLNEEQAVADYLAALSEAQAAGKVTRQEPANPAAGPEKILITEAEDSEPVRLPLGLIAVVVVIAVALFAGWKYYAKYGLPKLRHVRAAEQASALPAPKPVVAAQPAPAVTPAADASTTRAPAPQPAAAAHPAPAPEYLPAQSSTGGFVVKVRAKEDAWLSIVADGKPVMSGTLPLGVEKSVRAQHTVVLKTGNAAGVELFYNDKLVPPLGGAGQVRNVEFTPAGWRQ